MMVIFWVYYSLFSHPILASEDSFWIKTAQQKIYRLIKEKIYIYNLFFMIKKKIGSFLFYFYFIFMFLKFSPF